MKAKICYIPKFRVGMFFLAEQSKARTAYDCLNIGIAGSNPAWGRDVLSVCFCVVLSCVGRGLASGWSPSQGVLPNVSVCRL